MFKTLLPLSLAATFAPGFAWADDTLPAPSAADTFHSYDEAPAAADGDDTAAKERKGRAANKARRGNKAPSQAPASNQRPGLRNDSRPSQNDRQRGDGPDRADAPDRSSSPDRSEDSSRHNIERDGGPVDRDAARNAPDRDGANPAPFDARKDRTPASADRSAPEHRSAANAASNDRRPPGHVRAGNYRGPRPGSPAAHHAAAVHHAAVARHVAAVRHHTAAHAAWVARYHRPAGWWYRPWRAGYPHYWYHGVFVWGPPPVVVAGGGPGPSSERAESGPKRIVDHANKFSLGVRGGSYLSGYHGGASYGDAGLGLAARYRFIEPLGVEVSWQYHDQTWESGTERIQQPIMTSFEVFGFPWSRVNPYFLAGVTVTPRNVADDLSYADVETEKTLWGPHAGLGLELNLSKKVSLNFDARYIGYLNKEEDDLSVPAAFQANLGANFYF